MQFASAQWLPRSLLPLCTIRRDCFSATSIFQYKCRCWSGSGDVEINPGYVFECTIRPQRQDYTSKLKVFYTNARSIVNKVAKLQVELANSQADIVVLTETRLDCSISSEEVIGSDFIVYRKDCAGNGARHGGGVLIATKKGMITSIREHQDLPSELLFVDIITDDEKKLTIGTFYSDLKPLEDVFLRLQPQIFSSLAILS